MEDSEQRKKRLREMRMQADHADVSGAVEGSAMPGSLSNPLIEAPLTMPSWDKSNAAPRFDFYTDPMSAFSSNKRNNTSIQAAPDSFPPNVGPSPMAQYSSPHPDITESTNPRMTLPPFQVSAPAYGNLDFSGPRGPAHDNFLFHPSSVGRHPNPRFEPSGGPLYNSTQGIAHRASYSPNPSPGYRNSPGPSYSPNPSPGYSNSPRPSYSPNPSPGYRSNPRPGQGRGRGVWHNPGSSVSGRGSGRGPNFHGHLSNENPGPGPNRFYKSSMVEDPWNHLEPKIWEAINGSLHSSRIPEKVKPWISKSKSTIGEGSSAASVKFRSEPSLAEYLATAFNEAANDTENV
ncbi:protein SICKLE isoform X3 [Vigna umbellata]|nr:protein SICKLE isoform X3 [Vigna umbellata]XP_047169439.1 protein SICKLE isoform X3 [Vigna umbellata]